jgi:hypothetical protein
MKNILVFANDTYFSNSSLSIQIRDLNVCPTLNSSNFKSYFENYRMKLNIFNYYLLLKLNTHREGSEIDDSSLQDEAKVEGIHDDFSKTYIGSVGGNY